MAHRILKCQSCTKKFYLKLDREITYIACPKCGRQTPAQEQAGPRPANTRAINNPSNFV